MISGIWPILIMAIGFAAYMFASNPKLAELGKILFAAGAFAFAFFVSSKTFVL